MYGISTYWSSITTRGSVVVLVIAKNIFLSQLLIYLGDFITRSDMNTVFDGMIRFRLGYITCGDYIISSS